MKIIFLDALEAKIYKIKVACKYLLVIHILIM